jgi:hypothetical protein
MFVFKAVYQMKAAIDRQLYRDDYVPFRPLIMLFRSPLPSVA